MVGDLWRWSMQGPVENQDLAKFWRQVSRWLVKDSPAQVELTAERSEEAGVKLLLRAFDKEFRALDQARARVRVSAVSPDGESGFETVELEMAPESNNPGRFSVNLPIEDAGAFLAIAEVVDGSGRPVGSAETGWVNQPQVAEFSSLQPDAGYLERIAAATGGAMIALDQLDKLSSLLAARPSPMTETRSEPLWHTHWIFALAALCFLSEWAIRRRKGLA